MPDARPAKKVGEDEGEDIFFCHSLPQKKDTGPMGTVGGRGKFPIRPKPKPSPKAQAKMLRLIGKIPTEELFAGFNQSSKR